LRGCRGIRRLGVDLLMHMVMVLAQEHCTMRDRLDTLERLSDSDLPINAKSIDAYEPDHAVLEARELRRQTFLENLFSVMTQEAAEVASKDTRERFDTLIEELATEN
ncbi:MAG: hypothetical protein AAF004_15720, partial [Pseudomonadota bacterium]